jgi:hypothetical protein
MSKKATAIAIVEDETPQIDNATFYQMVGAARYANHLSNQTKSDVLRFAKLVRDNKLFLQCNLSSFDEFLESELSPMSRATFYRELELFEKEGEQYDLFNEWKIPARVRHQLAAGDYRIEGDEIVIGDDQRYGFGEGKVIKTAFEQLIREKIAANEELVKERSHAEAAMDKLAVATERLEYAQNEVERLKAGTPYDQALHEAIISLLTLSEKIGQLPEPDKPTKGSIALPQLEGAIERVADAYGLELFGGAR